MSRPTPTAGNGQALDKESGDKRRFACTSCGFPCKPGRDSEGGEASRKHTLESAAEPAYSEVVNGGCPSCGSKVWRKKPWLSLRKG